MNKFDITSEQIQLVVTEFYSRIRSDQELGPIFNAAIGTSAADWRAHEAKIASFWRNAAGLDRSYSGNPMLVHVKNSKVQPEHFSRWLRIFRDTAEDILPDGAAHGLADLADRIGQSLAMGIGQFRERHGNAPDLRSS